MTREEAIEYVKCAFEVLESESRLPHDNLDEERKACEMAIEALSNADQHVKSVDLISIQMAIEHWGRSSGNLTNNQIAELQREIESLPSAEPKAGEWIPCTKNGLFLTELIRKESVEKWYGYKCSECNYIHKGNALIEYRYCPNCGAKMGGDNDVCIRNR